MKNEKKHGFNSISIAVLGFAIIAGILIIDACILGRIADQDARGAVRNVSKLFLSELADRREQVVSSKLDDYVRDMDVAVGMLSKEDLTDAQTLQEYQLRFKQLFDLDKFAFVDTEGTIYTSRGTRKDIDQYDIDYMNLSEPEISVKNLHTDDKKVVIAVPVDHLKLEDHTLVVCFMEIDMDVLMRNFSSQSQNNTTSCSIYTPEGVALTDMVLGGLTSEDNLLDALQQASYEEGYSYEKVAVDFADGRSGEVSFSYNGISETLYYVPVHGTKWMLTYLIRESTIGEQINSIPALMILCSILLSVLTATVLTILFRILWKRQGEAVRSPGNDPEVGDNPGEGEKLPEEGFTDDLSKADNLLEELPKPDNLVEELPKPDNGVDHLSKTDNITDDSGELPGMVLEIHALDTQKGLEYCGDAEDYLFALRMFSESAEAKAAELEKSLRDGNRDDFIRLSHSLKSMTRSIGALGLSDQARDLEQAAGEREMESLSADTQKFVKEYRELGEKLKAI